MSSFFSAHGDQDLELSSIDSTKYESASSKFEPESGRKMSRAKKRHAKAKVKKKSWWQRVWRKRSKKKKSKKKKSKKKKKKKKKKTKTKKWRRGKTKVVMHSHHHATFARLVGDALVRLKSSPTHRSGYGHKRILKNIERHYKLKLGGKFKVRLRLSLERLVRKALLVPLGSKKRAHFKYKPSAEFLEKISQLKANDGGDTLQLAIQKYGSKSRSRTRSRSHRRKSRSHSRRRRRLKRRRKRRLGKRGRRKHRRSHRQRGSKSKQQHRKSHSSKKAQSEKGTRNTSWRGSVKNWFWPSKDNTIGGEKNDKSKSLSMERGIDRKQIVLTKLKHNMPKSRKKQRKLHRGSFGHMKGARYHRFNWLRIRERNGKHVFPSENPYRSVQRPEADALDNSLSETPPDSVSNISSNVDEDDNMSNNTLKGGNIQLVKSQSRKERSDGYLGHKSFLQKFGNTLHHVFGSKLMSTTGCEVGPSR